ncbi:Ubiquinone biosynthesis O-methyl transferase [Candidatus Thiomargarita nelsonii]|uniref:Ubiquinone biosynthesis O-methyl transferase n=1 Tax=Candidatus Thiomargarita nelsonii TaxID=1003181 RepID=A0A176S085_9GAMM|nr:Ubiquinone biosynthesis O-methyl transferase [Candidatus Thiomargarita nelsonii]
MLGDVESYTVAEFINATLGKMHKVKRDEHKGFDYDLLIEDISKYFEIHRVSGIPFGLLPTFLNFGVGIIGKTRNPEQS